MEWKNKLETFKSNLASLNLLADPGMKSHFWHVLFTGIYSEIISPSDTA